MALYDLFPSFFPFSKLQRDVSEFVSSLANRVISSSFSTLCHHPIFFRPFSQCPICPHPHFISSVSLIRFFRKVCAYSKGRFEKPPRCDDKDLWNPVLRIPRVFLPSYSTRPLRIFSFSIGLLDSSPSDVPSMLKGIRENCWHRQRAWGGGDESY